MFQTLFYNKTEKRLRSLIRLALQTGIYYSVNLGLYTFLGFLFFSILPMMGAEGGGNAGGGDGGDGAFGLTSSFLLTASVVTGLGVMGSVWWAGRFLDRRSFKEFGLDLDRDWWVDLGFGLVLGGGLMWGIFGVQVAAGWLTVTGVMVGMDGVGLMAGLAVPLALYIVVGIYEEVLFRGYRLRNLAEGFMPLGGDPRMALVLAWILSSAWFGLAHRNNPNASMVSNVNLALAGLFLGLGYIYTGRLGLSIGLHISWNFFQGNIFGFPVSGTRAFTMSLITIEQGGPTLWTGGAFGPEAGLVGIGAIVVGSLLILAWVKLRRGRIFLQFLLAIYAMPNVDRSLSNPHVVWVGSNSVEHSGNEPADLR